jgi:hypothetical protein
MPFTDRFIRLPTKIYNKEQKELTGNEELEDSYSMINPFDICEYRPAYPSEDENLQCVNVTLKCGNSMLAYMPIGEFEKLLNKIQ